MVLQESDPHLTTFITPHGRWRYICALQGYVSSDDGYNQSADEFLSEFTRKERCVDNICHYDNDLEEHWWQTIELLTILGKAGIIVNADKYQFASKIIEFAGFRISDDSIEPLPKYLDAIRNFPTPKNISDVCSWFGLVNQVANYAQLRHLPFKDFLSPKHPFIWTAKLDARFHSSKEQIVESIEHGVKIFDVTK